MNNQQIEDLLNDIYDVIAGNTMTMSQEEFCQKYKDLDMELDIPLARITFGNGECRLYMEVKGLDYD